MSNSFIDINNASGKPINCDESEYEQILANFRQTWNESESTVPGFKIGSTEEQTYNFGYIELSDSEVQQNIYDIWKILEGKESIDFVGISGVYMVLFRFVAQKKKILVNNLLSTMDPALIENSMISDTLVVAELPEDITEKITNGLSDKKNVIIGTLYKEEELANDSGFHK